MSISRKAVAAATIFLVLQLYSTSRSFAAESPANGGCTISGRVVNRTTGDGVGNASVQLLDASSPPDGLLSPWDGMVGTIGPSTIASSKYSADTKHDGAFCFSAPASGQYRLFASKAGYLNSSYIEDGPIIEISSQRETLPPLLVGIAPFSGISGSVVDSAGEPLMNVNMVAVKRSEIQGRVVLMPVQGTQSNELGEFRIGKLVPGIYYVYAQPLPSKATEAIMSMSLVRTYYPTSLTLAASTPITLGVGEEASGVLVHVQSAQMSHVVGRVLGPPDLWGGSTVDLHYADEDQMAMLYGPNLSAEGTYDFPRVAPGRYLLTVRSTRGGGHRMIEVSSSDVTADIEFVPNATVSGTWVVQRARAAGAAAVPRIDLTAADAVIGSSYVATVRPDGTFSADGVFPGRYFVKVSPASGTYLKQLRIGNRESFSGALDLTAGRSPEIKIEIAVGGSTLSGDIKAMTQAGAKTAPNRARVVLVPNPGRTDGADIRFSAADEAGHFSFTNLAPGDYQVFGLVSASGQLLQNAMLLHEVASSLGKEVSVREGGHSEPVELALLANEAIAGTLRSHGAEVTVLKERK